VSLFFLLSCGSDFSSPTNTVETFLNAAKDKDEETYLSCLEKRDREWIDEMSKKSGKKDEESDFLTDEDSPTDYEIGEEKIDGDKATVEVTTESKGKKEKATISLVKEDGDWKIDMIPEELKSFGDMMEGMGKELEGMMKGDGK